jgi:predicted deacylase
MPVQHHSIQLPVMTPGTARSIPWLRFGRKGARPKAYLQAAIHANEMPGTMALHHLMPMLAAADQEGRLRGEVVVVPAVNPIGHAQLVGNQHLGRYHLLSYENFNRNWIDLAPAVAERLGTLLSPQPSTEVSGAHSNSEQAAIAPKQRGARGGSRPSGDDLVRLIRQTALEVLAAMPTLQELRTLRVEVQKLSIDADFVLDLHCDINAAMHLFMNGRDFPEGPATRNGAAYALAADLGSKATLYNEPYPAALTFSGVHGALWARLAERFPALEIPQACMACTVEMRGQHDVSHEQGRSDALNLLRWLTRQGIVDGDPGSLPKLSVAASPMEGMDVGYCPGTGFLAYHVRPGTRVREGQAICDVINPADPGGESARTPVVARTDGVLFSRRLDGSLAWPGMVLFRIAGAKRLVHRAGLSGLDD